jgi:hypothetical protein
MFRTPPRPNFLEDINRLDPNCDPLPAPVFRLCGPGHGTARRAKLNGAHFHPERVSLPMRSVPINIGGPVEEVNDV